MLSIFNICIIAAILPTYNIFGRFAQMTEPSSVHEFDSHTIDRFLLIIHLHSVNAFEKVLLKKFAGKIVSGFSQNYNF